MKLHLECPGRFLQVHQIISLLSLLHFLTSHAGPSQQDVLPKAVGIWWVYHAEKRTSRYKGKLL